MHTTQFMKTRIDIKSALIGLSLGVLVALGVGAASPPISVSVGRYQVACAGNDGLIIDTATGQAWRAHFPPDRGTTDGDFFTPKIAEKK
jgi:hypothetical protein